MNRALGCVVLLLAPVLIYGVWVSLPPSRYEAMSVKILSDGAARHAEEQKVARRPDRNAYIDPDFLTYWGREGTEKREPSVAKDELSVLNGLCDLHEGKDIQLETRHRQPAIRKRFHQFARFYPRIHRICSLPELVMPMSQPQDMLSPNSNYIAFRAIPQYLSGYAEFLVIENKPDEALEVASDSLRFSGLVQRRQWSLIRSMIGLATQSIAQSTLAMVLEGIRPQGPLESLLRTLEETQLPPSGFSNCLEAEYCLAMNAIPALNKQSPPTSWVPPLPGLESREFRLYKNDYLEMLQQVGQNQPINSSWVSNFGMSDWFLGRHSILAAIVIGNYTKTAGQFDLVRRRQAFLHAFVGILQFRQQTGRFPASLDQLRASGYKPLGGLDPKRLIYELKGGRASLKLTLSPGELPHGPVVAEPGMEKWNRLNGLNWVLQAPQK